MQDGYACLVDFGLAANVSEAALKGKCGTRGYWAPEMVKGEQYLYSVDWWSLGVTLVELITGKKPFKKKFQKYKHTDDKASGRVVGWGSGRACEASAWPRRARACARRVRVAMAQRSSG